MKVASSIEYRVGEPMPGTKWVVRGKLGRGGMGLVLDVVKGNWIQGAMKVLLPPFAKVPEFATRFLDEVKVTAQLQHANIVQVLDFDRLEDGTPFFVMERLRGRTLGAALRDTQLLGKAWTAANTYAVAAQVCDGLYRAHAHAPAMVHRDVKPDNLYLHRAEGSLDSVVKVMDFGVAAVVGERDRRGIGTPRYMAPEQVSGDSVSPQTDQYAMALVVYEMLTGRFAWDVNLRDVSAIAEVHLRVAPIPPSRFCPWLPERVDAAILKALSKEPSARHESLHGLIFELSELQWANDRPSSTASDANTTAPMVGTLAEGFQRVREEHDTSEGMSPLLFEGRSPEVPELNLASEVSVAFSEQPGERAGHVSQAASSDGAVLDGNDSVARREIGAAPNTLQRNIEQVALAMRGAMREDHSPAGAHSTDTPMTGESAGDSPHERSGERSARLGRRGAIGLLIAAAAVGVLVTAGISRSSRVSEGKQLNQIESRTLGDGLGKRDSIGEEPRQAVMATDGRDAQAELAPPPPLGWPGDLVDAGTGSARLDRGPAVSAVRKVAPAPLRPALRAAAAAKGSIPDDGRDELYVPGAR